MTSRILDTQSLLAERRAAPQIDLRLPYSVNRKEKHVLTRLTHGELRVISMRGAAGELLTTPPGLDAYIQRYVIDLQVGREAVPLLYGPLYRELTDANFPQYVAVRSLNGLRTVFLEHLEAEEITFGARVFGQEDTVPIRTFATLWQRTEEVTLYDATWTETEQSRATGEAYNALLNHLHLYPIIHYSDDPGYPPDNQTPAEPAPTDPAGRLDMEVYRLRLRQTLINAQRNAAARVNPLTRRAMRPSVLLAHPLRRPELEDAMQRMTINATEYPAVSGIDTMIFYDGYAIQVGDKFYEYPGCPEDRCYLIEPQTFARSLIKHDLRTDADNADISRLIEMQVVSRARRGVYCAPEAMVMEVMFPA